MHACMHACIYVAALQGNVQHSHPSVLSIPGRERVALGDALQASHFAGGEVPLEARGLRREGHLEVVSAWAQAGGPKMRLKHWKMGEK